MEIQSLANYLDTTAHTGNIPSSSELVHLLMPIATALDSAHRRGEVHGALKPSVILFDTRRATLSLPGEPTLTNFGMHQRQDPRLLSPNDASYVAPEVAQGQASTSRSDLYSLGVILYELCTGVLPFQGETSSDILMQHIHSVPLSPVLINPNIRPALTAVIMRSLARDPAARYSSATALVTAAAKAMNVSLPESTSRLDSAPAVSMSNINDPNTPTYLTPPRPSPSESLLPTAASSNAPDLPQSPVVPSIAPVLPPSASGPIPQMQSSMPQQASGLHPIVSTSGPMPVIPVYQQASGPHPVVSARGPTPFTPPPPWPVQRPQGSLFARATSTRNRRISVFAALALLLVVVILGSAVLLYRVTTPASSTIVGHTFFLSSGLISKESNQGTTDGLRLSLQNVDNPQSGKNYYGWLMSSGTDLPVALGPLSVDHRQISVTYDDPYHNNLLAHYNRFLVTEGDASQPPTNPPLDVGQWRYYSAFSTVPSQTDPNHFSLLDHLRHLLAQDPKLEKVGLQGGLSVWLFRNTTKVLEVAGSARDTRKGCVEACDTGFILRQVARILDYLDGAQYVQTENIPPSIQGDQLLIDPNVARVALLEFDTVRQQPPGYLEHIGHHLHDLTQVSGVTAGQRTLANSINQDINNVQGWLNAVHTDASKLIQMSPTDLMKPEALTTLNDLFAQANSAFVGHVDPNTGIVKDGVVQIYYNIQALATFDVVPCTMNNGKSSCAEGENGQ